MVLSAAVTRRALSLGDRDDKTGWCAKEWTETTIDAIILQAGESIHRGDFNFVARYNNSMLTPSEVREGYEIKDADNKYYAVETVKQLWTFDRFDGYVATMTWQKHHADRAATSGTWHLDSDSTVTDVRYRTKAWYEGYDAAIYKDNGSTPATKVLMFAKPDYPLWNEIVDNDVDAIGYISAVESQPLYAIENHIQKLYGFEESVTIALRAVNKTGITATNLLEQFEQDISHVATDHSTGSRRRIEVKRYPEPEDIGGLLLFKIDITIKYKRWNDDYTPAYPTITWGPSANPTGTYIIPNVLNTPEEGTNKDLWTDILSYSGTDPQGGGSKSLDIEFICDVDIDASATSGKPTWKRPQTTQPKTDNSNWDIFRDLLHNEGIDQPYHTLTFSATGPTFYVRLLDYRVEPTGEGNQLRVRFREDRETTAAALTYKQRLGIT